MAYRSQLPEKIHRCESCFMHILDDSEHSCDHHPGRKLCVMRTPVYAAIPLPMFELKVKGEMFHLNINTWKFEPIFDGKMLLSPSTDGLVCFEKKDDSFVASYVSASFHYFSIIVASYSEDTYRLMFRVETTPYHGLKFYKLDSNLVQNHQNGRIVLPSEYKWNTALILGVDSKSRWMDFRVFANTSGDIDCKNFNGYTVSPLIGTHEDNALEHQVKADTARVLCTILQSVNDLPSDNEDGAYGISHSQYSLADTDIWSLYVASKNYETFPVYDVLKRVRFDQQLYYPARETEFCFNCGKLENMQCFFPMYFSRCYRCLVISLDGSGHTSPCAPLNTISDIRKDIFVRKPIPLFKLRVKKVDGSMHYLNKDNGLFEELTDGQILLSSATDGLYSFKRSENYGILSYDATTFHRFSFIIAVLGTDLNWRARYRGVLTTTHGVLLFRLRSTLGEENGIFGVPREFKLNKTIVLGIKPVQNSFKMEFSIFANENGYMDDRLFNGYRGFATWTAEATPNGRDYCGIDEELDGQKQHPRRLFDRRIKPESSEPVASFHSQRGKRN